MDKAVKVVVEELNKQAITIGTDKGKIKQVATISANNDSTIGELIADAFDKVGTLSSRRVQSNDYYYKYLDHYTPGSIRFEKGTKSSAADRRTKYANFIPFE